jgi:ankyrin repeat protein
LHEVGAAGDHVRPDETVPFAVALLDAGARTDVRDELFRSTPLGWACRFGRIEIVRVLLERGADREEDDTEPWARPRAWARRAGHAEILDLLHGVRPEASS